MVVDEVGMGEDPGDEVVEGVQAFEAEEGGEGGAGDAMRGLGDKGLRPPLWRKA